MRPKSGFILIIVVALLGVLAYLALSLLEHSKLARTLSTAYLLESQTKLVARSGIEKGKQWILRPFLEAGGPSPATSLMGTVLPVNIPAYDTVIASVRIDDSSGRICLNDGMKAGQAELGALYNSQALDPWPSATPGVQDISAWINIRLRSLLNAYGDVQRFAAFLLPSSQSTQGWPAWQGANTEPTYNNGVAFDHSATDTADRFTSIPPRLLDGTITTPAGSAGLGDRIIGARPVKGYADVEQIRTIVDQWWADTKPAGHVETDFFGRVSSDFTVEAWHDKAFWRMKREFGGNHAVYTDQADYQNDVTNPLTGALMDIEATPPDFTNIWKPHPVPPINLNAASDAVRAAIFHAPVNVSLVAESTLSDTVDWAAPYSFGLSVNAGRPTLGVAAPLVVASRLMENGRLVNAGSALTRNQRNRLLSVRDSMICAQAYRNIALAVGWPDSFERLAWHLRRCLINGGHQVRTLERASIKTLPLNLPNSEYGKTGYSAALGSAVQNVGGGDPGGGISQWALVEFFPHLLSCQRRLPAWMGAPIALTSPWRRHAFSHNFLRSVEDFVFRSPLPKVTFQPTGTFPLMSSAFIQRGSMTCHRRISAVVQAYESTVLRDQASFISITDNALGATSPEIQIGPEIGGTPSPHLGTVGLRDRGEVIPGGTMLNDTKPVLGARYDFNSYKKHPSSTTTVGHMNPSSSDSDAVTGSGVTPGFGHEELMSSGMEGPPFSIFPRAGQEACDLSPFGGVYFSSFNHGIHKAKPFGDSFYFRPANFLLEPPLNNHVGKWGNSGLVSLWVRMPTGCNSYGSLMHMTLWEKMTARLNLAPPAPPGTVEERFHPLDFHLYLSGKIAYFKLTPGHSGNGFGGPPAIPDSGYYFQNWPLSVMPLPTSRADYETNPVFKSMFPPMGQYPLPATAWTYDFQTSGQPEMGFWGLSSPYIVPMNSYLHRPGSWTRLVARWDFTKYSTRFNGLAGPELFLVPHITSNVNFNSSNGNSQSLFNPKMVMSFGERQYQVRPSSATSIVAPIGTLLPVDRLNSCLDNIVVQFGGFPNSSFEALTTSTPLQTWNAIQAIPGFDNRRYNVRPAGAQALSEPVWVINPKLPSGSKILQFGARIYDVPFYPEYDPVGGSLSSWTVLAPRVDLSMAQGVTPVTPLRSALPIIDQTIEIHSNPWLAYPMLPSASGTRFKLTYRSVDAMNRPLTQDVLTDIPWIQEVNWAWIPPTGVRILSWKEE